MSLIAWLQGFRKTYTVTVDCTNCQKTSRMFIPKGTTPQEHFKQQGCPTCGVKGGIET